MKVKDVDDMDENWPANVSSPHACMQDLALLVPAVCLMYIIVHFMADERIYV